MLWACDDCLRMLPHTAFDNHRIFGLGYRKPVPDSPIVTKFTSWEPASTGQDPTADEAWRQRHHLGIESEIEVLQRRYRIAITQIHNNERWDQRQLRSRLAWFQECGIAAFEEMTFEDFVELSKEQEVDC